MRPRLVLATGNRAKAAEFRALLAGLGFDVRDLGDYPGLVLPPEGATSYHDNARSKARAVTRATGTIALGDDSGIEVDALGGRPGVESARYGGPELTDALRAVRLLGEVADRTPRTARFRCVVALAAPWGEEAVVEGEVEGLLADAPRGTGGFGYDPIFLLPGLARTMAELRPEEKGAVSHRGRAVVAARPILERWARRAATAPGPR